MVLIKGGGSYDWLSDKGHEKQVFFLQILDRFYEIMPGDAAYFPKYFSPAISIINLIWRNTGKASPYAPQQTPFLFSLQAFFLIDRSIAKVL